MTPFEKVVELVRIRVEAINCLVLHNSSESDAIKRKIAELNGMMLCLRNLNDDEEAHYCINYLENGSVEFGFYKNHEWTTIA